MAIPLFSWYLLADCVEVRIVDLVNEGVAELKSRIGLAQIAVMHFNFKGDSEKFWHALATCVGT